MTAPGVAKTLSGTDLRGMFAAATRWLEHNKEAVNAINVFPVPDGDTGTNMHLTMRATMEEADLCTDETAGGMMAAIAHGALMGARGNSGVILSQVLRGMARSSDGKQDLDAAGMASALSDGAEAAYRAVTKPVEGTILTVARDVGEAATQAAGDEADVTEFMRVVVDAARASVERTPTLLPVLAEAGVVDAGGQGYRVLLEGMLRHLLGEELPESVADATEVGRNWLSAVEQRHQVEASPYGYCAEVLLEGTGLDVDSLRETTLALGDSVIVVGDEQLVRIHVHTDDPGAVLTNGTRVGSLVQVKIDNINRQAERFVEMHQTDVGSATVAAGPVTGEVSCVAVASGDGLAQVFRSAGCAQVVSGGPTMNPSTGEILEAIGNCPTDDVIVLPNDKNIVLAAEQAVPLAQKRVRVVKSKSVPQGIAALLAINPEHGLDDNAEAMEEALPTVRTVEITRSVRTTSIKGVAVTEGQAIAVVDDELRLGAESPEDAAVQALQDIAGQSSTSLISLYYGAETTESQANGLADRLRAEIAGHEVDVIYGGQPHYQYIISLE